MSQLLIITGMHRSGTSLITSILQQSGLPIGEQLVPAAEGNPHGFFEDQAFMLLHQAMLHARSVTNLVDRGFRLCRMMRRRRKPARSFPSAALSRCGAGKIRAPRCFSISGMACYLTPA